MEAKIISPKENAIVVRHNRLLEARYETTLQQQRIMLWLISEIRPEDRDFQTYRVSIKELAQFIGLEGNKNIYKEIAQATKGMIGRVIEIGTLESDEYVQVTLVSAAKYHLGEGYVDLEISPTLRPYLLDLKANFTKAFLHDLMAMKSIYAIRLYDLLNQYRKIGTRRLEISELKKIFRLDKKYKLYADFKKRVIEVALAEIHAKTDLVVTFTEEKRGRKTEALIFTFTVKKGFVLSQDVPQELPNVGLLELLTRHGMRENQASELVALYGDTDPDRIRLNVEKLERELVEGKNIKRPAAWLKKAIEDDWRDQKTLFQQSREQAELENAQRAKVRREKERKLENIKREIERLEMAYLSYRQEFVRSIINKLSNEELTRWEDDFELTLDPMFKDWWLKNREWESRSMIPKAEKFIKSKTGQECLPEALFLSQNGFSSKDALEVQRMALL